MKTDADVFNWCARQESNLYQELRRLPFYPLNYGRKGRYCSVFEQVSPPPWGRVCNTRLQPL